MNMIISTAIITLCAISAQGQDYDTLLIPYRKGELWGYCRPDKKLVIAPQFKEASMFEGPITSVKCDSEYCVINKKGVVLYKRNSYTGVVNKGRHYVTHKNSYNAQLHDEYGKAVTKVYNGIESYNQYGYAVVTSGYVKKGLIDKEYKEILPAMYGSVEFVTDKIVQVYEDKKGYGLIELATGKIIAEGYGKIYAPREGLMMVEKGGLYGFMNMEGKEIIALKYDKEIPDEEQPNVRYNESTYENYRYDGYYEGLAVVRKDGKAGYIDKQGKVAIPFEYERAYGFERGRAWVKSGGRWGIIDRKGKYVFAPKCTEPAMLSAKELSALDGYSEGLIAVRTDTTYGYIDTNGTMVIAPKYTRAFPFYGGMAAVYMGELMGFIDRTGTFVIPPKYKWVEGAGIYNAQPFEYGVGVALLPCDEWQLIDKKGHPLLPMKFSADNNIWFENGRASATAYGKQYIIDTAGKIVHTFNKAGYTTQYTKDIYYSYAEKCFVNIRTKVRYCE